MRAHQQQLRRFIGRIFFDYTAQLDDGALDCIAIRDMAPWARVPLFARGMRGTHLSSTHVGFHRDRHFLLRFETPPMFETDGELQQAASCELTVSVRAGALAVIV
jgi:diacylglycerol kinase family enzyme